MDKLVKTGRGLGTRITLTVFGERDEAALDAAFTLIAREEDRLTVNRPISEVMAVNRAAGKLATGAGAGAAPATEAVTVSAGTFALIAQAVAASRENYGFNALIGPLVKLWKIGFEGANVPTDDAIAARRALIDPSKVVLDAAALTVSLQESGMELDLGGIAKGYIADQIRALWGAYGVRAGIIDLGGNLLFVGDSPRREDAHWVIGVQDPRQSRHTDLGQVILPACSAVTSGVYERFLEKDGRRYHHLLDPRTGYPLETELAGVTVFTKDSTQGELEAKRLFFAGGPVPGWEESPGHFGAVFVYADDSVRTVGLTLRGASSELLALNG